MTYNRNIVSAPTHGGQVPCLYMDGKKFEFMAVFYVMDDFGDAVRLDNMQLYHRLMASNSNLSTAWSL